MRRLNVWQRFGVVVSALWIVGGGIWQRNSDVSLADRMAFYTYQDCKDLPHTEPPLGTSPALAADPSIDWCATNTQAARDSVMKESWSNVADLALFPVPVGWALAYVLLGIARWVLAGRKRI
jgi:hypothetical protein